MQRTFRSMLGVMVLLGLCLAAIQPIMAAPKVTLKVFVRAGVAGGSAAETEWEKKILAAFEKENPDIKLDIITPAGGDYLAKLTTLWAAGQPPDVWDHGGAVATYVNEGWLLDLMPYVKRDLAELNADDFFTGCWKAYQWGGHFWAMPFVSMAYPVQYNVDLLDAAGLPVPPVDWEDLSWNWDRMVEYARKLTRIGPGGRVEQAGVEIRTNETYLPIYAHLWGGDWFDKQTYETSIPNKCVISSAENELAYQKVVDLSRMYGMPVSGGFWGGKVGMVISTSPLEIMAGAAATRGSNVRWGLAPIPRGTHAAALIATDPWMVSSKTKHPEEAWRFIKYMASQKVMESYTTFGLAPVARRSALMDYLNKASKLSGYQSPRDILSVLAGGQKYGHEALDHIIVGWRPWLEQVISQEFPPMIAQQRSVREALVRAQKAIESKILMIRKK